MRTLSWGCGVQSTTLAVMSAPLTPCAQDPHEP